MSICITTCYSLQEWRRGGEGEKRRGEKRRGERRGGREEREEDTNNGSSILIKLAELIRAD